MSSWKISQSKKQKSKQLRLAFVAFSLILCLILLAQVFKFTQMFFNPWTKPKIQNSYRWDGHSNINIVVRSDSIKLFSYNPKDQKITVVEIPDQIYLDVPGGLGSWQLSSVFGLGGGELLKQTLVNFFGMPIDGYLDSASLNDLTDKNPFSLLTLLPKIKTDLTPFELLKLKMGISGVRFDKIYEINLEEIGLLDKSNLADGTEIFEGDPFRIDSLSGDLADSVIKSEHKTVAIFNSTNHSGIAQKVARILNNIGADVIIVSNGKDKYAKTIVTGEKSETLEKIKQIFGSKDNQSLPLSDDKDNQSLPLSDDKGKIDPGNEDLASSRAQINVFLGEDYFNKL